MKIIYTVPPHVGQNIEVPKGSKVTFYDPSVSRFTICSDNSGHEYFIPLDSVVAFEVWVSAEEGGIPTLFNFSDNRIDGRFTFTDPRCE